MVQAHGERPWVSIAKQPCLTMSGGGTQVWRTSSTENYYQLNGGTIAQLFSIPAASGSYSRYAKICIFQGRRHCSGCHHTKV